MEMIKKVWGYEEVVQNSKLYCGKLLHVKKDYQCSLHYHKLKDETFYILSGSVWFETRKLNGSIGGGTMKMGQSIHLPPKTVHRFSAIDEDCTIIEFSTPHKDSDSYRLEESCKIKT